MFVFLQLSESESEDETENEAASEKKAAHSSGKKYIPPKIAPVHYGNVTGLLYKVLQYSFGVFLLGFFCCYWGFLGGGWDCYSKLIIFFFSCLFVNQKINPLHPDGDMTEADKKKAKLERHRQAALRSSVIQELRQQYSDAPEEIRDKRDFQSERESREELHRFLLIYFTHRWVLGGHNVCYLI